MSVALFYNVDLDILQASASQPQPLAGLIMRRGQPMSVPLTFVDNAGVVQDPGDIAVALCLKTKGKFDENPPLLLIEDWVKSGADTSALWTATFNVLSSAIDTALGINGDSSDDVASVATMLSISYGPVGDEPAQSAALLGQLQNAVNRGTETPPWPIINPGKAVVLSPAITDFVGGSPSDLDSIVTKGVFAPNTLTFIHAPDPLTGATRWWFAQLLAGTQVTNVAAGYLRPPDYAAGTWEYVWNLS